MATYRFYAQLQKGNDNRATSDNNNLSEPATNSEAVSVIEGLKELGKKELPKKAWSDFESTVDAVIGWVEAQSKYVPGKNGDITVARRTFTYANATYRVDIGVGGKLSEGTWFN